MPRGRVQAEMGNPKADILVGGSVDLYGSLATAGAFEAYDSPNNDSLDARFNDPNHFWQGWYMGVLSIIINEERFEKELTPKGVKMPETWDDLLDPNYKDVFVWANPTTAGGRLHRHCLPDLPLGRGRCVGLSEGSGSERTSLL